VRRLALLLALCVALAAPAVAAAHPLGNFTVNQFTRIQPSGDRIYLLYVLDLAEIPTFQERDDVRAFGEAAYSTQLVEEIRAGLSLVVGGAALPLRELDHEIAFPAGVGGLETTRLEIVFEAGPLAPEVAQSLVYHDRNFEGRIGWREIVLVPDAGAQVQVGSVPRESISDELRAYPDDLLESPPDVRRATAELTPGESAGAAPTLRGEPARSPRAAPEDVNGFAGLVAKEELSTGVILVSLLVALFWGAVHALSPGHGKAIVAAYLVGTRGTPRQAFLLGGIVTATHTLGVFALGLVTLALSEFIVPDQLYPWLNLVAGILVVGVGLAVLRLRVGYFAPPGGRRGAEAREFDGQGHHHPRAHHHDHPGGHHDHHYHPHPHEHRVPEPGIGWRGLLGVGISGGLLPCPSALVVLLAAISLHRVGYGLVLILAFSLGLAATITGIGLLAISTRGITRRVSLQGPVVRALPALSALAILAFGIAMTIRAVPTL
jgi:ABC-type nickel/cobalt efflux system permease component RcnA